MKSPRLLWSGFISSRARYPHRPAIDVGGQEVTYERLGIRAMALAATIQAHALSDDIPLTAIFAYRSETAYAAVLATLMAGRGYLPLNRTFPVDRTRLMLEKSLCRYVIVDDGSESQLPELLNGASRRLVIICPDRSQVSDLAATFSVHQFIGADDLCDPDNWRVVDTNRDSIAYLLFTSGSTGEPKA